MGHTALHFSAIWLSMWGTLITYNRISQESHNAPDIFDRPVCPRCGGLMWLALIEPDKPDHDRRTFECRECENTLVAIVKYR